MNSLAKKIKDKFGDICTLDGSKKNLKFEAIFEYEEDEEKKGNDKEEEIGDCSMVIELLKYKDGKYLLEFRRTKGRIPDYYHHFKKIKEIIIKQLN